MNRIIAACAAFLSGVADKAHAALFGYLHSCGMVLAMDRVPTAADFDARRVTNPATSEIVRQRFYDWQLYATAGAAQLTFFSAPIGQGVTTALGAVVGTTKTQWDTNLELPNTLPSGKAFMMESIEVVFYPGSVATANTYTPANISLFVVAAAAAVAGQANDVNTFYQSGLLELNVLSKNYLRESPLMSFPPKCDIALDAAVSTNSATVGEVALVKAKSAGRAYYIEPEIALQPAVNFDVTLKWPAAVPTGSGFNARLGIILDGFFMRASQ